MNSLCLNLIIWENWKILRVYNGKDRADWGYLTAQEVRDLKWLGVFFAVNEKLYYFIGSGLPVLVGVGIFDVFQEIGVVGSWIFIPSAFAVKIDVVWVDIEEGQTAVLGDPGGFGFPNVDGWFF